MRNLGQTGGAIALTTIVWIAIRLVFPQFDYYPPEILFGIFERSWIVEAGLRKFAMVAYVVIELIMLTVVFAVVQAGWPGRRGQKGVAFGVSIGIVWALGFLTGWAFMGTGLQAELLNGILDIPPLALGGWLIGRAIGRDTPEPESSATRSWPAILFVAGGYLLVHTVVTAALSGPLGAPSVLLAIPETLLQFALLSVLGLFVGAMYVMLRPGLPRKFFGAGAALFAFAVFGHCWTWFQLFFVIEFDGVIAILLLLAFIDAAGVFIGAAAYELTLGGARRKMSPSSTTA